MNVQCLDLALTDIIIESQDRSHLNSWCDEPIGGTSNAECLDTARLFSPHFYGGFDGNCRKRC
jgi:hypothetical protein